MSDPFEDTISLSGVMAITGRRKQAVLRYVARSDFPQPIGIAAGIRLWSRREVSAWTARTLPLRIGRPRNKA